MNERELEMLAELLDKKLNPLSNELNTIKEDVKSMKKDIKDMKKDVKLLKGGESVIIEELDRLQTNLERKIERALTR